MSAFDFPASPTVGQLYDSGAGIVYRWTGVAWVVNSSAGTLVNNQRVVTFTAPGSTPYVKPAGLHAVLVELWGPGGGGGGAGATTATTMAAGGGGGGGGYTRKLYQASELAASESLVIGAGGAAGTSVANGGTGTATTFKSQTAPSGTGGAVNAASSAIGGTSGRGITNIGTGGDYNSGGTSGQPGVKFYSGSANTAMPGYGGPGWGGALTFPTPTTTQNSQAGTKSPAGGGGNGSANAFSQTAVDAGAGGDGIAIFTEYYYSTDTVPMSMLLDQRVSRYTTPGTTAYVKPANLKYLQVEIFGAGGGSGGAAVTAATNFSVGGGGGGGGYTRKLYTAAELAVSENLVIGNGGGGGDGVSAGGVAGETSTFKALSVTGGGGGAAGTAATTAGSVSRGIGGVGSGGDLNGGGNSGHYGIRLPHGVPLSVQPGYGGAGYGQSQYFFDGITTTTSVPAPVVVPGTGANGAGNGINQTLTPGAKGGDAYAVFTEYLDANYVVGGTSALDNLTLGSTASTTSFLKILGANNIGPRLELETSSTDTNFGPNLNFYRNVVGETEYLGNISWYNNSNAGAKREMAAIYASSYQVTNPGDSSEVFFGARNGGSWNDIFSIWGTTFDLTCGKILFPATQQVSTNPNALDDYEEGVWTPTIIGGTTAGVASGGSVFGRYTKTGRDVHIEAFISWTGHTGTGNLRIGGMPFTGAASWGTVAAAYVSGLTFTGQVGIYCQSSATYMSVVSSVSNAVSTFVQMDTASDGIYINMDYTAA